VDRADALDAVIRPRLAQIAAAHPSVRRADGLGLHWTLELHGGGPDRRGESAAPAPAERAAAAALDAGVLLATRDEETSLFIAPPLIVADSELDLILRALDRALSVADAALAADQES
jgi:4-aminobutyrate aminotransferase-like enzyme